MKLNKWASIISLSLAMLCFNASADVVLSTTRIIYKEGSKTVNVRMENQGSRPLLIQTWMDRGNKDSDPGTITAPFVITPPISRIDPKRGQTVSFLYSGSEPLAKDRESVFWFNVLEIPPKVTESARKDASVLQMAFRTRIKLFYRPESIGGDLAAAKAIEVVKWSTGIENGKVIIKGKNDSPFHVSYVSAKIISGHKIIDLESSMIAPFSQGSFAVKNNQSIPAGSTIEYNAINDFGGIVKGKSPIL
ncbi:fimbrial chaperone [Citrobacter sp. FP75]|uniref:fimbrial chaperone n=1 Tax=Citrobacter sp. FP75 TaxID=1852949 RepID=UPI001BC95E74|nr:fimbrial chaperone [Citrobacter sp. FP75]